jgi:23S rRNA (adenine2503-C2)-methyltransferase
VVFMGMGEPLANFDAVASAVTRMTNRRWGLGLPPRRITLSTAGLATRVKDVVTLGINLAVSLNATTEPLRARLMPAASRVHPLKSLLAACRRYPLPPHRRLTFEYVLLSGVNDHPDDAVRLAKLLNGMRCKINLIPLNEFPGSGFMRPSDAAVAAFQAELRRRGFDVFVRMSRGRDVLGACGQLGRLPSAPRPVALTRSEARC